MRGGWRKPARSADARSIAIWPSWKRPGFASLISPTGRVISWLGDCWLQPTQLDDKEALALLILSRLVTVPRPFGPLWPIQHGRGQGRPDAPRELRDRVGMAAN